MGASKESKNQVSFLSRPVPVRSGQGSKIFEGTYVKSVHEKFPSKFFFSLSLSRSSCSSFFKILPIEKDWPDVANCCQQHFFLLFFAFCFRVTLCVSRMK